MNRSRSRVQNSRPVYREAGHIYRADNCRPLIEASKAGHVTLFGVGRSGYPGRRLGTEQLPGLRSAGYWNAGPGQTWGLPLHRNEGIEISFVADGQTAVEIDGRGRMLSHDEFMITRPWQPHQIGNPNVGSCRLIWMIVDVGVRRPHQAWNWPDWVVLDPVDRAFLTRCLRQNEQFIWRGSSEIRRCFLSIAQTVEMKASSTCISWLAVRINELLLAILDAFRERKIALRQTLTSAERTVRLFLQELEVALDRPWPLESMAESCHLGVTQFAHYFRAETNMTPSKYLNHARIRKACTMLVSQPETSITEIGSACGFSSSQYFTNVFRQQMQCAPREYRKKGRGGGPKGNENAGE